jgi:transcriptional regulator with XRE-family HTH domain
MRLRDARLQRFLSVRELAAAAGVSPTTIVDTERGARVPHFSSARKIAAALGISPGEIDEFTARIDLATGKGAA